MKTNPVSRLARLAAVCAAFFALGLAALHAVDGSLQFANGTGQRVAVPNFAGLGISTECTVEFWVYSTSASIFQSVFMLDPDVGTNRFQSHINFSNGNSYWDFGDITAAAPNSGRLITPSQPAWLNNWTHFALVASQTGGFMKIYANGLQVASANTFNAMDAISAVLNIGGNVGSTFQGRIDDFRIWNVARSQPDILRDHARQLLGNEPGLRLYMKFDEGSGTTAANSATATGSAFNGTLLGNSGLPAWSTPAPKNALVVTNNSDSGAGSLRQKIIDAAAGDTITFDPLLSGQTITLASEIVLGKNVIIDAGNLPAGVTINGGAGSNRIFSVDPGQSVSLTALTLTGGNGGGAAFDGNGGAILNQGTLTLASCTLTANQAFSGGAILNFAGATLTLTRSNLSGNNTVGQNGAAIFNQGTLELSFCTLSANHSSSEGGAIMNYQGQLTLNHCTLSGNSAVFAGGAIISGAPLTLTNCIIAGNNAPEGPDIYRFGSTITATGKNLIGNLADSSLTDNATVDVVANPLLAPLGNYGGRTQTMPPLPGSPAIDASVGSTATTDQRGFPVIGVPDIGAAESATAVTTTVDELDTPAGANISLREALRDTLPGGLIGFAPALSGGTCTLGSEIVLAKSVTLDASSLPAGISIDGGLGSNRIFSINAGQKVALRHLTLTGGNGGGATFPGFGGAIFNNGTLALGHCTLTNHVATGFSGGAIYNGNSLSLTRCTLFGNSADSAGGAIFNAATLTLTHCTLSGNSAASGGALGSEGQMTLTNNLVSGNNAPTGPDIATYTDLGAITSASGRNLIGDLNDSALTAGFTVITAPALLAPAGHYGGPTQTMALRPGSPALNAAAVLSPAITADQRGFPIVGTPDIGAYEAGTINSFATWSWESAGSALAFGNDDEKDGAINGLEYATRRDPSVSDVPLSPAVTPIGGGGNTFQFRYQKDARDLRYIVQRSPDLALPGSGWVEIYRYDSSTGQITELLPATGDENATTQLITITDPAVGTQFFWRLLIEPVP